MICDCLNECGDDPKLDKGLAAPCQHRLDELERRKKAAQVSAMIPKAFQIADEAMFELLASESISTDGFQKTFCLLNEVGGEAASVAEASQAIQDAVEWLSARGYIEISEVDNKEHILVLHRPGDEGYSAIDTHK